MINIITYIFLFLLVILMNFFFLKKRILLKFSGNTHQNFVGNDQVTLIGGIIIFIFFIFNFFATYNYFLISMASFFILGICADYNFPKKPITRFFLQVFLIMIFVSSFNLFVPSISIDFLDNFLQNKYFNLFFLIFCFIVLINGSNFIDGNNTLSLGYFILLYSTIVQNEFLLPEELNQKFIISFIIVLSILYFFNLINKVYLGDNGVYLLSVITGFILVKMYNLNLQISPFFIANLLWYPAFEGLFSFLRKVRIGNKSPLNADTSHLHQLIYFNLKRKIKNKVIRNGFTGNLINAYNFIIFIIISQNISSAKFQVLCLLISIFIYLIIYFYLYKKKKV